MKQLIILVCYIKVDNSSQLRVREHISEINLVLNNTFSEELQDETNTIIKTITIPVKNQQTCIECIYPAEPDLPEDIKEKLNQIELTQKEYYDTNRSEN